ncbi:hypothetical protein Bbelb_356860 [Branchiostoma belcheri]|nr:hypothetical protein Bbelb_356860 [Branchiostoma belcheri]
MACRVTVRKIARAQAAPQYAGALDGFSFDAALLEKTVSVHRARHALGSSIRPAWLRQRVTVTPYKLQASSSSGDKAAKMLVELLTVLVLPCVALLLSWKLWTQYYTWSDTDTGSDLPLPPGSMGLPFIGETLSLVWQVTELSPYISCDNRAADPALYILLLNGWKSDGVTPGQVPAGTIETWRAGNPWSSPGE